MRHTFVTLMLVVFIALPIFTLAQVAEPEERLEGQRDELESDEIESMDNPELEKAAAQLRVKEARAEAARAEAEAAESRLRTVETEKAIIEAETERDKARTKLAKRKAKSKHATLSIDLAELGPGAEVTRSIQPKDHYKFRVLNKVPSKYCSTSVEIEEIPTPALTLPDALKAPADGDGLEAFGLRAIPESEKCDERIERAFKSVESPTDVRAAIAQLRDEPGPCGQAEIQSWIERETQIFLDNGGPGWSVRKGQKIVVTAKCGDTERTMSFTTGLKGRWDPTYGFTFVPNEDEIFFSKTGDTDGTFVITEENDNEELDFAPSILFQYRQPGKKGGWLAGLGHDLDNVMLFGGYGWSYKENITFAVGAVVHEQDRLDGRFSPDDVLKEQLGTDQLLESTFDANVFFGISFRFDRDPHTERAKLEKKLAEAQESAKKEAKKALAEQEKKENQREVCLSQAEIDLLKAKKKCDAGQAGDACRDLAQARHELAKKKCKLDPTSGSEPNTDSDDGDGNDGDGDDGDGDADEENG